MIFELTSTLIISYLFGSVPYGFIIGKMKGIDIRKYGSKNIGATNVTRVIGKPFGYTCFVLDFLKGFIPSYLMTFVIILPSAPKDVGIIFAITGTFVGHIFPIYLKFRGGKGVATGAGSIMPLTPLAIVAGLSIWIIIFKITKYVSLASITAAVVVPVLTIALSAAKIYNLSVALQVFVTIVGMIAIIKHKTNITRLITGTEYRFRK